MTTPLVQPLFDGPVDIVGDVHGEIEALRSLMHHLGYADDGPHPNDRRLVFVGDLTDRGPEESSFDGTFRGCLGAVRIPENCVVFDNGDIKQIERIP